DLVLGARLAQRRAKLAQLGDLEPAVLGEQRGHRVVEVPLDRLDRGDVAGVGHGHLRDDGTRGRTNEKRTVATNRPSPCPGAPTRTRPCSSSWPALAPANGPSCLPW